VKQFSSGIPHSREFWASIGRRVSARLAVRNRGGAKQPGSRLLAHVEEPPPLTNAQSDVYVDRMGARHGPVLLPIFGVKPADQLAGSALILVPLVRLLHIRREDPRGFSLE
jgi:hypothetical protein